MTLLQRIILLLVVATIFSCSSRNGIESNIEISDSKATPTLVSDSLELEYYKGSDRSYYFKTPKLERFLLVDSPYMNFKYGVHIQTFDSLNNVTTQLDADYAHYNEKARLWEAKGNVVAKDSAGKILLTEQLFWDEANQKVYSNLLTKVVNGDEVTIGNGFTSDDKLENIEFKETRGRILMDTSKNSKKADTLSVDTIKTK